MKEKIDKVFQFKEIGVYESPILQKCEEQKDKGVQKIFFPRNERKEKRNPELKHQKLFF